MTTVRMKQHAVGQGGLTSGTLTTGSGLVRWVYDCGSNQTDSLASEIANVARDGPVDFLFLSHLDSDHIKGVDLLLASCSVGEVVLPYLADETIVAIIASDLSRGRLSGFLLDAAPDIAGWFASRGVRTITFINGEDDDALNDNDQDPPTSTEGGDGFGPVEAKWWPLPEVKAEHPKRFALNDAPSVSRVAGVDAALIFGNARATLNWVLLPYVHAPPTRLMNAFLGALESAFGQPLNLFEVVAAARSERGRAMLRQCYDALWLDHNLVSMTLYAGPRVDEAIYSEVRLGQQHSNDFRSPGWMLTGDAHLEQKRRRERFFLRYRKIIDTVGVLMLPHHGSAHNFDEELIDAIPELRICFAASGSNSYGHPHKSVQRQVEARPRLTFHRVSAARLSRMVSDIYL